ncbi:hypothetical protein C4F49_07910 [Sphingobacterium sp. KB22]|uniref:Uncharacterized protein n=1 Tax=Sphingobacterium hungaricum TaxID=2082723 RepID=A0A928UVR3_9SPHI|nr:hypothetical protein [Sphingobacterium hungaricum]
MKLCGLIFWEEIAEDAEKFTEDTELGVKSSLFLCGINFGKKAAEHKEMFTKDEGLAIERTSYLNFLKIAKPI